MEDAEIIALSAKVRRLQKEFYRLKPADRPPGLLKQCKDAEKALDRALEDRKNAQGGLF